MNGKVSDIERDLDMTSFAQMNNNKDENTYLRDAFLPSVIEKVRELKKDPHFRAVVCDLQQQYSAEELNAFARKILDEIGSDRVEKEMLEAYELEAICCLAAIVDFKQERFLDADASEKESNKRGAMEIKIKNQGKTPAKPHSPKNAGLEK